MGLDGGISRCLKMHTSLIYAAQYPRMATGFLITSETQAERALANGDALFVINFPANFDRSVDRGEAPTVLVDADGTDPTAIDR